MVYYYDYLDEYLLLVYYYFTYYRHYSMHLFVRLEISSLFCIVKQLRSLGYFLA